MLSNQWDIVDSDAFSLTLSRALDTELQDMDCPETDRMSTSSSWTFVLTISRLMYQET